MTKKEIILRKKDDYCRVRKYKRFHTTIDENILKKIRINAIELDMNVNQIIEMMYDFASGIDDDVMLDMLRESLKKDCKCGELISTVWREHKEIMEEKEC